MEKDFEELKLALAKKPAEPPPPPPTPKPPEPRAPRKRTVYIYRPLQDKKQDVDLDEAPRKVAQKKVDIDDDEPSSFGFGTTTVTKVDPDGKGTIDSDH